MKSCGSTPVSYTHLESNDTSHKCAYKAIAAGVDSALYGIAQSEHSAYCGKTGIAAYHTIDDSYDSHGHKSFKCTAAYFGGSWMDAHDLFYHLFKLL